MNEDKDKLIQELRDALQWADERLGQYRRVKRQNDEYCDRRDAIRALIRRAGGQQ